MKRIHCVIFVAVILSASLEAAAQNCVPVPVDGTANGLVRYKVHPNLGGINNGDLSFDEVLTAVQTGADAWNDNSSSRYFRYDGVQNFSTSDLTSQTACNSAGITTDLVMESDCFPGLTGAASHAAVQEICGGSRRLIIIFRTINPEVAPPATCLPILWGVGDPAAGEVDLVSTLTHEFGHVVGLEHPNVNEVAVMSPGYPDNVPLIESSIRRDLFHYDISCPYNLHQPRGIKAYVRALSPAGAWGPETPIGLGLDPEPQSNISDVSGGWTAFKQASGFSTSIAAMRSDGLVWKKGLAFSGAGTTLVTTSERDAAIGPTNVIWRDLDPSMQRIFFSAAGDSPRFSFSGVHRVRSRRSTNGFASSTSANLSSCSSMSSFFVCNGTAPVNSGEPITSAFLPRNLGPAHPAGASVTAWVNQTRDDGPNDRRVKVSIGAISDTVLPLPVDLTVRSSVAVGLACTTGLEYDCVLAYVSPQSALGQVHVKRFNVTAVGTHYSVIEEPGIRTLDVFAGTATRIGMIFQNEAGTVNDRFWIVFRSLVAGQPLEAWSSQDGGETWLRDPTFTAQSAVGPSFMQHAFTETPSLVYAR